MPIPSDTTNIAAIAAGYDHDLFLKKDGTVTTVGLNQFGQADVPPGLSNVAMIAAGGDHNLALTSNGTLIAWGRDTYSWGQSIVSPAATNVSSAVRFRTQPGAEKR
jgi:alpha-tubulin suppressor-like RCC1 family protein